MMNSDFNDILFDSSLSDAEIVEKLRKRAKESEVTEKLISDGNFDSPIFDKDRECIYKECELDYMPKIWEKLSEQSRKDLKNAYFYSIFIKKIDDDESTPIMKLTKTVENEIRNKLFIKFANEFVYEKLVVADKSDEIFDNCLNQYEIESKLSISLGQMLYLIKESYFAKTTKSNYAFELRCFLENNKWDISFFYSKKNKKFYIKYPEKYRNDSAHEYVYDASLTNECKEETKEILTWLISSYEN